MNKRQRKSHLFLWAVIALGLLAGMWAATDGILHGQQEETSVLKVNKVDAQVFLDNDDFIVRGSRDEYWVEIVVKRPLKNAAAAVRFTVYDKPYDAGVISAAGVYRIPWTINEPTALQIYDGIKEQEILKLDLPWE